MNPDLSRVLSQLLGTLELDVQGYRHLSALLEAQFRAALAHHAATMERLAQEIVEVAEAIELRKPLREDVLAQLLGRRGERGTLRALLARLPASAPQLLRARLDSVREQLEQLALDCKRLNLRNCEMIHEQHALMQRLLGQPEVSYAQP
jgi:flagella synthesis protein FlgN